MIDRKERNSMTDDETLVAELRGFENAHRVQSAPFVSVRRPDHEEYADRYKRAADRIEALETELAEQRRQTQRAQTVAAANLVQLQCERARRKVAISARDASRLLRKVTEQERDALKAELEARLNGPTAERYRLERDALAAAIAEALDVLLSAAPRDVLREHDERVASAAVIGVQGWMAADLGSALGHADPTAVNDGERSWADWWARLIHEVRETPERVWDEGLNAAIEADIADAGYGNAQYPPNPYRRIEGSKTE